MESKSKSSIKYLSQSEAISLDRELFDEFAFSVDQLMELAGLSVAVAIAKTYPNSKYHKPIICCGPGNNGGDGLVSARHLKLFGYSPIVICPKPSKNQLYQNLLIQCKKFDIPIMDQAPTDQELGTIGNLIIDSVFGFSFEPPNRNEDFAKLLNLMHDASGASSSQKDDTATIPLVSVDVPSGWNVESGIERLEEEQANVEQKLRIPALSPDCLISLTAPKLCAKSFKGRFHYLGGRFCPKILQEKYKLNLPDYPGTEGILLLS